MPRFRPQSVTARVAEEIRRLAEEAGPGARLPSVRALRETLGISHAPLDAALGQLEREGVLERRQGLGVFVKERINLSRCAILYDARLIYGGNNSPFWPLLLQCLMREGSERGWEPVLHLTIPGKWPDLPDQVESNAVHVTLVNELKGGHVKGALAIGLTQSVYNYLDSFGVPMAVFAGYGRRRVQLSGPLLLSLALEEAAKDGYSDALVYHMTGITRSDCIREGSRFGIKAQPLESVSGDQALIREMVVDHVTSGFETAFLLDREAFEGKAIVSGTDMFTQGLLLGLRLRGLEPQRDFGVYTHANIGTSALLGWQTEIVQIAYDPVEISRRLFDLLDGAITGVMPDHAELAPGSPISPGLDWSSFYAPRVVRHSAKELGELREKS